MIHIIAIALFVLVTPVLYPIDGLRSKSRTMAMILSVHLLATPAILILTAMLLVGTGILHVTAWVITWLWFLGSAIPVLLVCMRRKPLIESPKS